MAFAETTARLWEQPCCDSQLASSDESELIQRAVSDPKAVAALYRRHHTAIAKYVRRRVGCCHEADDLVAETFLAMVKYLPRYRARGVPFRAWLYRLATTQVNRWVRRNRRSMRSLAQGNLQLYSEDPKGGQVDDAEQVRVALMSLPPDLQTVLSLYYMEGLAVAEIAQVLKCAPGTVKSRLARGRKKMRMRLNDRGEKP